MSYFLRLSLTVPYKKILIRIHTTHSNIIPLNSVNVDKLDSFPFPSNYLNECEGIGKNRTYSLIIHGEGIYIFLRIAI